MLSRLIPAAGWLSTYRKEDIRGDLNAGLTVGVMLIPQGMAYAMIAGLEPVYGLYAALVPLFIYALFGTSRQLAVGPVAMVSLLVAAGITEFADQGTDAYIGLALSLAFLSGSIQLLLGLCRFGFATRLLSHPVLGGFTSAAALIIGLNQLKYLLGIPIPRSNNVFSILATAADQLGDIHLLTLGFGVIGIVLLVGLRRWRPTFPAALLSVVLGTLVVYVFGLDGQGVQIVGIVPRGLPKVGLPSLSLSEWTDLLPAALAISLVGFMESVAVAKAFASKHRYRVDANKELVALGLSNVIGAFFQAYPTTGGFSRTAVNDQAGARTPLATIISGVVVGLTLLFLTPLFYYLPKALLASVVMVAVSGLIDWKEARFLLKTSAPDLILFVLTFGATLLLGIEEGILVGVAASILTVLQQASTPHTARLGRLPGTTAYRNRIRFPDADLPSGIEVLRIDASLFFANVDHLRDQLEMIVRETPELRGIVLDAYPINRLDATAVHSLVSIVEELTAKQIAIYFAGVKGPVMDMFHRSGLEAAVGSDRFFGDIHSAVEAAQAESS